MMFSGSRSHSSTLFSPQGLTHDIWLLLQICAGVLKHTATLWKSINKQVHPTADAFNNHGYIKVFDNSFY
jgi:hypothetical protein